MCPALLAASFRGAFTPRSGLSAHFSTNDLSHVLSTGALNTLPVHMGWDLTYQAAYCITPGACTNLPTPLNGLSIVPCQAETYTAARCCAGLTLNVSVVEDGYLAGSVLHCVQRKGEGPQNSS